MNLCFLFNQRSEDSLRQEHWSGTTSCPKQRLQPIGTPGAWHILCRRRKLLWNRRKWLSVSARPTLRPSLCTSAPRRRTTWLCCYGKTVGDTLTDRQTDRLSNRDVIIRCLWTPGNCRRTKSSDDPLAAIPTYIAVSFTHGNGNEQPWFSQIVSTNEQIHNSWFCVLELLNVTFPCHGWAGNEYALWISLFIRPTGCNGPAQWGRYYIFMHQYQYLLRVLIWVQSCNREPSTLFDSEVTTSGCVAIITLTLATYWRWLDTQNSELWGAPLAHRVESVPLHSLQQPGFDSARSNLLHVLLSPIPACLTSNVCHE